MRAKTFDVAAKRVYVAGHRGMVGAAIVRRLASSSCDVVTAWHGEIRFLAETQPDVVIVAAAKVGGIHANSAYPVDFISNNIAIARNIVRASYKSGVKKLLFLGSSCILSTIGAATDPRGRAFERTARANQRMVRDRQNRWSEVVSGVSTPIRRQFHLDYAD